ncbi:MAG: filamentous hemagglutinin N-terminal domain-containing protein, partial [Verrucomicrobiae bacterium]|nr:filamentous hemagglutinin N-terminal domain-containing protein [Verrucomicrobiae bacterium]
MKADPPVPALPLRIVALAVIGGLAVPPPAGANPLGEAVRHGDVQFERIDGQLRILQASDKAIIDWESFSIGAGELTQFFQPGSRSAALNRVRGASASTIEGALRANGRVYLINPNGILIGPSGTVDVGGFVASTLDV